MSPFGKKRFVSLGDVFQWFVFWNLKDVGQIQWLGAWAVSHWNGDGEVWRSRKEEKMICKRGMKKKTRQ